MGLNDLYCQFRGQIMLMESFSSIIKIISLTLQEEKQRRILDSSGQNVDTSTTLTMKISLGSSMTKNSNIPHQNSRGPQ